MTKKPHQTLLSGCTRDLRVGFKIPHIIKRPLCSCPLCPSLRETPSDGRKTWASRSWGAPRSSQRSRTRGVTGGPYDLPPSGCKKNVSDPTWAAFRSTGNIWEVFSWRLGKYLLPNLALRCSRTQTNLGLKSGAGVGRPACCLVPTGGLAGGRQLGEGRIKHLVPRLRLLASLF